MGIKEILWPWGVIRDREQDIAILEDRVCSGKKALMDRIQSSLVNIEYGARQRSISSNLRSECMRLHEEVQRLNETLEDLASIAHDDGSASHCRDIARLRPFSLQAQREPDNKPDNCSDTI